MKSLRLLAGLFLAILLDLNSEPGQWIVAVDAISTNQHETCQWENTTDTILAGENLLVLIEQTAPDYCLRLCASDAKCRSVEHSVTEGKCQLSEKTRHSLDVELKTAVSSQKVTLYEWLCKVDGVSTTSSPERGETQSGPSLYELINKNPEYAAMVGMGILIVLLAVVIISMVCYLTRNATVREDEEKILG